MTARFTPPVRRVERAHGGHAYLDARDLEIPGVTTLIDAGLPKPALTKWAANATAEAAVNRWDELAAMPVSTRLRTLQSARYEDRDRAKDQGTKVHALAEKLVTGEKVRVPDLLAGHVESYVAFLDAFDPNPILVETTVYNLSHGFCGTLDLLADIDHPELGRTLCDIKTSRSGVFGETAFQLAAYRHAEHYLDVAGTPHPMIKVDACAAIHVRANGYTVYPLDAGPATYRAFRYIQQVAEAAQRANDLIGPPIDPPEGTHHDRT